MAITVLLPHSTAQRCYLSEALHWVALARFPLESLSHDGVDSREDTDIIEGIEPNVPYEDTVTAAECALMGLSTNPLWALVEQGDYPSDPEDLRKLLQLNLDAPDRSRLEGKLVEALEFRVRQDEWDREFKSFLDLHAAKLFIALREGKLTAIGKKLPYDTIAEAVERLDATEWAGFKLEWEPIPANYWALDRTKWLESTADGHGVCYCLILVEVDDLLSAFPAPAGTIANVLRLGDTLVMEDQPHTHPQASRRMGGRPAFNWEDFHVEMAKRARSGNLPQKQEALIADMQDWCRARWNRSVARSTLLQKIKPYYDALVRESETAAD